MEQITILYVDDDEMILRLGKEMLEDWGYKVVKVSCCMEALRLFCDHPFEFDLIITDYEMPFMNGKQFSKKLRQIRNDIPIIMATARQDISDKAMCSEGINGLVIKPYEAEELDSVIKALIAK
jgi:CheY-like chemotaxis protein